LQLAHRKSERPVVIAEQGNGRYITIDTAKDLGAALEKTLD
jgi:hypothetical protein